MARRKADDDQGLFRPRQPVAQPLADRMRPRALDEVVGQEHLLGPGKLLSQMVAAGTLHSMVLWGPPGAGKTTIALLLTQQSDAIFKSIAAVAAGVAVISAFIKSMRGSDPDAALYWMTRMVEAGEDALFIARRMVIFAAEDIGNADPRALQVAIAVKEAVEFVGLPEGVIPLAQGVTYLAGASKSNASYRAMNAAREDARKLGALPVPLHLRNAPTKLMSNLGYGKEYLYPHDFADAIVGQGYLPDHLDGRIYYSPSDRGYEARIREYLDRVRRMRAAARTATAELTGKKRP